MKSPRPQRRLCGTLPHVVSGVVLICRVLMGHWAPNHTGGAFAPKRAAPDGSMVECDSMLYNPPDTPGAHREWVVYKSPQALPEYAVTFG